MFGNTYRRVPQTEGGAGLPTPSTEPGREGSSGRAGVASASLFASSLGGRLGRTRTRWIVLGSVVIIVILVLSLSSDSDTARAYAGKLSPSRWAHGYGSSSNPFLNQALQSSTHGDWNDEQFDQHGWVKGSGRKNLTYNSPFNPEDYSLTEDECDAFFPGLWKEIDRSVDYFTNTQK